MRRLNSPYITALLVVFFFGTFLLALCKHRHSYAASQFVVAGNRACDPLRVPANLIVEPGDGYDGQFFYRLSLNPFTHRVTDYGITLDNAPYRAQRIFYPFLAYVASLGSPLRAARSLIFINLLALAGVGYLGGLYAQERRLHALWGTLIGLNPGAFVSLQRDTCEIVALFFTLLTLHLAQRRRYTLSALALTAAILTRETTVVVGVALVASLLLPWLTKKAKGERGDTLPASTDADPRPVWVWQQALPYLVPFAVFAGWQLSLTHLWGAPPSSGSGHNLGLPLGGIWERVQTLSAWADAPHRTFLAAQLLFVAFTFVATAFSLRQSIAQREIKIAWCLYALLAICYSILVYVEGNAFMRVEVDLFALSSLILLAGSANARTAAATRSLLLCAVLAVNLVQCYGFVFYG